MTHADIAAAGSQNIAVTFPFTFTGTPVVTCTPRNPRLNLGMSGESATGFTVRAFNWTGSTALTDAIKWHAILLG